MYGSIWLRRFFLGMCGISQKLVQTNEITIAATIPAAIVIVVTTYSIKGIIIKCIVRLRKFQEGR